MLAYRPEEVTTPSVGVVKGRSGFKVLPTHERLQSYSNALRMAARARMRVESSVGSGELWSSMVSEIHKGVPSCLYSFISVLSLRSEDK